MKNKISLLTKIGTAVAGYASKSDLTKLTISREDSGVSGETMNNLKTDIDTLGHTIEDMIKQTLSVEGSFTPAQMEAAKAIAVLAISPAQTLNMKLAKMDADITISNEDSNIDDAIMANTLSTEAFDGQAINNAMMFSIVYNFGASKQDQFGEAFYPTIIADPLSSGFEIETEFVSLVSEVERSKSGASDASKFKKIPIVKAIYDNDLIIGDKNKLVPVKRAESAAMFLSGYDSVDKSTGTDITTAPLLVGKTISLLGISQTDALLAKGEMDNTDSLDRTINLEKLFVTVEGKGAADADVTEVIAFDINKLPGSNFTYTTQGHNKDLALTFSSEMLVINTSVTKTAKGATSAILSELTANHKIILAVKVHGEANTSDGDISVYGSRLEIIDIQDANGSSIPAGDSEYVAIVTAMGKLSITAYTVEAYRTNSNLRTRGQLVTSDRYKQAYNIPLRSGVTVLRPTSDAFGDDNDSKIAAQVKLAGVKTSANAVKTLLDHASLLKSLIGSGVKSEVPMVGISRHHVNTYFLEETISLPDFVDSIRSSERRADIKAALVSKINDMVLDMYVKSNYGVVFDTFNNMSNEKFEIIIGTDPIIKSYLCGLRNDVIELEEGLTARVASTPNKLIAGKMYITFGVISKDANTVPNPLNFGQCAWVPTISTDIVRTVNGATVRELHNIPRFLHITNLPILAVISVNDISGAIGKISQNNHAV